MFESIQHFWSFRDKQCCIQIQYNGVWVSIATSASIATSSCRPLEWNHVVNDVVSSHSWMPIVDTWMTPHEQYGGMLCCFIMFEVVVTIYLNCIGLHWIWMPIVDTWMTPHEQYGGMLCCFIMFEVVVTIYLNCIGFGCSTVYPWNSKGVLWTQTLHPPPPPPLAQWRVDNEWLYIFLWIIPLSTHTSHWWS